jgi:hypothetical protein
MPAASGVFKQLSYKVESSYGVAPGTTLFTPLRRVTSDLNLTKDVYQSNEIRTDQQMQDMRHGVRRVQGSITGELAPGAYADFMAAALRRDFAAVTQVTGLSLTIATSGSDYTVSGVTGALTSGIKIGDVVRISAGTGLNADVLNKNLLVLNIVTTTLTVRVLNGSSITTGSGTACTIQVPGKKTYAPTSSHTNRSFAFEHWFSDMSPTLSELYLGCQPTGVELQLPATGLATVNMGFVGQSVTTSTSRYPTTFNAANAKGLCAAVNGILAIGGTPVANITGASVSLQSNRSGDPVVGSNTVPTLFAGRILASGQLTAYFESATLRDAFLNETDTSLIIALTADNAAAADFVTLTMPRIKVNGHTVNDGEGGLVATIPYQALLPATGGSGVANELTTLSIHDSAA